MKQKSAKLPITKKQLEILLILYQFRFLHTTIIQQLLHHKNPTRVQQWLQYLTKKGYVIQFYDRTTLIGRTKPAVYCLATYARKILKNEKACDEYVLSQIYRERKRSEEFRAHCCYIAEMYLQFRDIYNGQNGEGNIRFFTKTELIGYDYFPKPLPDAYFAIMKKGTKRRRYFLEIFDQNIPKRALKGKIRRYIASEEEWRENTHDDNFPVTLFIMRNKFKQRSMYKLIQRIRDNEEYSELPFYITNKEEIREKGMRNMKWQKVEKDDW